MEISTLNIAASICVGVGAAFGSKKITFRQAACLGAVSSAVAAIAKTYFLGNNGSSRWAFWLTQKVVVLDFHVFHQWPLLSTITIIAVTTLFSYTLSHVIHALKRKETPSQTPHVPFEQLEALLHPQAGPKNEGGKEIQKVEPYEKWLDEEYANKNSPTYQAYQSLIPEGNKAFFIGIRGDGDCGFRAMIVSLLVELATDPEYATKFPLMMQRLEALEKDYRDVLSGYEQLNDDWLTQLKACRKNPEKLVDLLNNDQFLGALTRKFRFLSNVVCLKDFEQLPEGIRMQLEHGEGAEQGVDSFLRRHATVNVEKESNVPGHLFCGVSHIQVLCQKLGCAYKIDVIDQGKNEPQKPVTFCPETPLLKLRLICRNMRHFDVIHGKKS